MNTLEQGEIMVIAIRSHVLLIKMSLANGGMKTQLVNIGYFTVVYVTHSWDLNHQNFVDHQIFF